MLQRRIIPIDPSPTKILFDESPVTQTRLYELCPSTLVHDEPFQCMTAGIAAALTLLSSVTHTSFDARAQTLRNTSSVVIPGIVTAEAKPECDSSHLAPSK